MVLRALKKSNIMNPVVVARDGVEVLDYVFNTGKYSDAPPNVVPQLVLPDLKLPKVDGPQFLKHIRTDVRPKHLPVVVFRSSSEEEDLIKSYELGANSYVRKPIAFEQFLEATRTLGLYWLLMNQTPSGDH